MTSNRRKARKDTYLSKRGAKNKRFLVTAASLLLVSSLGFAYLNSSMNKENDEMKKDIVSSQKKLEDIKGEIEVLKDDYEMRNTDEFKEKIAKERLGMVKKGEASSEENSVIKPVEGEEGENTQNLSQENQANGDSEQGQVNQSENPENPIENGDNTTDNADGR